MGAVAGVGAVVAAPVVIAGVGFGAGGIAAGSMAANMMSASWSSGLGMGAIASLQSAGAAGIGTASSVLIGGTGAAVGTAAGKAAEVLINKRENNAADGMTSTGPMQESYKCCRKKSVNREKKDIMQPE